MMITRISRQRVNARRAKTHRGWPRGCRQSIFSPLLPVCLVLSLGLTPSCYAQARNNAVADEPQEAKYRDVVELLLDKKEWSQTEPITGTILFRLLPAGNVREAKETVRLKGPQLAIQFANNNKADPSATLTTIKFHGRIDNPVRLSHRYAVPFVFDVDESFKKLLHELDRPFPIFKTGQWKMKAVVNSPFTWGGLSIDIQLERHRNMPRPELYGRFESLWVPFEVKPTSDEALSRQDILRALDKALPEAKLSIIKYYAKEELLSAVDLILLMSEADPLLGGHIGELYFRSGHPLSELPLFFEWAPNEVSLSRGTMPFFLLIRPGEQITLTNPGDVKYTIHAFNNFHSITPHGEATLTAPQKEGVYKVAPYPYNHRSTDSKPWGWFLVYHGESREPAP